MAPRTEHTAFVFLGQLLKLKGTDASWKGDDEVPGKFQVRRDFDLEENTSRIVTVYHYCSIWRVIGCTEPDSFSSKRHLVYHQEVSQSEINRKMALGPIGVFSV